MGVCGCSNPRNKRNTSDEKENHKNDYINLIIAEIYIKDDEVNKNTRIINSYEEFKRADMFKPFDMNKMNEEHIKACEIKINDNVIPFNYFHIFQNPGNYRIKYSFKENLTKTNCMFFGCKCLTKLDFSNFNTQNVDDMEGMFNGCSSLKELNISNFNTQKVTNMAHMFYGCSSLSQFNLSNFDTSNVNNMCALFERCESLTRLDLSNFNVEKVTNMVWMFCDCSALEYLNLSSFKINDNADLGDMFEGCKCLKKENIIYQDKKLDLQLLMGLSIV